MSSRTVVSAACETDTSEGTIIRIARMNERNFFIFLSLKNNVYFANYFNFITFFKMCQVKNWLVNIKCRKLNLKAASSQKIHQMRDAKCSDEIDIIANI